MLKLQVIGNLGKDCTTNAVNGSNVINFNVAHTDKSRDADNNPTEKTIWVECAYWTEKTGVVPFLRKGQQVYLEGLPEMKTYMKKDGTTGTALSLRVLSLQLIGYAAPDGSSRPSDREKTRKKVLEDDLPF